MITLSELSDDFANLITKELEYTEEKKEVIAYAIETALLSIFGTLLLIIFGLLVNALKPALIAALSGVLLRRVSGGAHFNTPLKCLVSGTLVYSSIGLLAKTLVENYFFNDYALLLLWLFSLIVVFLLAPVESENKPINSVRLKSSLKVISIIFVFASFFISFISGSLLIEVSMCSGVFCQSLTLLPIFNRRGGD